MKIFLDTADTYAIKDYFETGLVDGVTTNPTLIMKSGRNPDDVYQKIKDIGVKDISMEVMGNFVEMYTEASRLSQKFGDVATIKVPQIIMRYPYVSLIVKNVILVICTIADGSSKTLQRLIIIFLVKVSLSNIV